MLLPFKELFLGFSLLRQTLCVALTAQGAIIWWIWLSDGWLAALRAPVVWLLLPALTHPLSGRCPEAAAAVLPGKAGKEREGWIAASIPLIPWHSCAQTRAFSTCQGCCLLELHPLFHFGRWEFIHLYKFNLGPLEKFPPKMIWRIVLLKRSCFKQSASPQFLRFKHSSVNHGR